MKPSPCTPDRNDVVEIGGSDVVPVTVHRGGLICLLIQKLYLALFRRKFCLGTLHPIFEEWVQNEAGLVQRNAQHNRQNVSAGSDTLSVSLCEPIDIKIFHKDISPILGEVVELDGRVWYPAKVCHRGHNLYAGTATLSLVVHEQNAGQFWRLSTRPPQTHIGGKGWSLEGVGPISNRKRALYNNAFLLASHRDKGAIYQPFYRNTEMSQTDRQIYRL